MQRRALTLVEVVVVLAIMAILAALLLVGVQSARETSRRLHCTNNLRQFSLAIAQYESAWGVFPPGSNKEIHSPHYTCLPYLEQRVEPEEAGMVPLAVFLCPSDGAGPMVYGKATTNYVCNSGTWWNDKTGFDGPFAYWDEFFKGSPPFGPSAMTRGLSNISALSEVIHADGTMSRMRVNWNLSQRHAEMDRLALDCRGVPPNAVSEGFGGDPFMKGGKWSYANVAVTLYNHVLGPNEASCYNDEDVTTAAFSASSFHPGIVNVAYLDGHIAPVSDQIDIEAWRRQAPRDASLRRE